MFRAYSRSLLHKFLLSGSLLLGAGGGFLGFQTPALAAKSVVLTYDADQVAVTIPEMENFAATGNLSPQLQSFFETSEAVPTTWSSILTDTVQIPSFIESFLLSVKGRHVLHQFDQFIDDTGSQTLINLDKAVAAAMQDGSISLLEIIQDYPEATITIDLKTVEVVYNDVVALVEGIDQGNWEVAAKDLLQDLLCTCQASSTADEDLFTVAELDPQTLHSEASCSDLTAVMPMPEELVGQ